MTADQIDGVEPIHEVRGPVSFRAAPTPSTRRPLECFVPTQDWDCALGDEIDDGGDPPRIWAQDQEYPGTAFTRSIGDSLAESLGVMAEPELDHHQIKAKDAGFPLCARREAMERIAWSIGAKSGKRLRQKH